jgi:hypothetical protein
MSSKKSKAEKLEEDLAEKEEKASSAMKLALDTLDRGLEVVRGTHRSAKRLRASVDALDFHPRHLVSVKK